MKQHGDNYLHVPERCTAHMTETCIAQGCNVELLFHWPIRHAFNKSKHFDIVLIGILLALSKAILIVLVFQCS